MLAFLNRPSLNIWPPEESMAPMKSWLPSAKIAAQLGTTVRHVSRLCREGRLKASQVGREWLVDPNSAVKYLSTLQTAHRPWSQHRPSSNGKLTSRTK